MNRFNHVWLQKLSSFNLVRAWRGRETSQGQEDYKWNLLGSFNTVAYEGWDSHKVGAKKTPHESKTASPGTRKKTCLVLFLSYSDKSSSKNKGLLYTVSGGTHPSEQWRCGSRRLIFYTASAVWEKEQEVKLVYKKKKNVSMSLVTQTCKGSPLKGSLIFLNSTTGDQVFTHRRLWGLFYIQVTMTVEMFNSYPSLSSSHRWSTETSTSEKVARRLLPGGKSSIHFLRKIATVWKRKLCLTLGPSQTHHRSFFPCI